MKPGFGNLSIRGSESMHASANPHYGFAALVAVALVVIPWSLVGWLIWTLIN
jgi:metal-dependent amidase/aminoacylase/carboxypeptidase family protein